MKWKPLIVTVVWLGCVRLASAETIEVCTFKENKLTVSKGSVNLVARLENPPKTRVTLSISGRGNFHREIVWDPAVGDGLKHDLLLPLNETKPYTLLAYAEEDRVQASQLLVTTTTQFTACTKEEHDRAVKRIEDCKDRQSEKAECKGELDVRCKAYDPTDGNQTLLVSSQRTVALSAGSTPKNADGTRTIEALSTNFSNWTPRIRLECETDGVELAELHLDHKQLYAASVSRGFLDQAAPAVVTDTLSLLAEIAVERAKSGALEIVRQRFVTPICQHLDLRLLRLGNEGEQAFPRTCAMLQNMRLEDLFSSGRNLVEAARDDVRLTLVPALVKRANIPAPARDVAILALELGNQLLDGGNDVAEIDLLLTRLDRMFARGAFSSFPQVNDAFIAETLQSLAALGPEILKEDRQQLIRQVLERVLPVDPGALLSKHVANTAAETLLAARLGLGKIDACKRPKDDPGAYVAADKVKCVEALVTVIVGMDDWLAFLKTATSISTDQLVGLIAAIRESRNVDGATFEDWIESYVSKLDKATFNVLHGIDLQSLRRSCAVRITVAIVKWCSGRDNCTAAEITTAFDAPQSLFKKPSNSQNFRDLICWKDDALQIPTVRTQYVELANRAFGFLTPPAKGDERKRVEAILKWVFDLARSIDPNAASTVTELEEIFELFQQRDYVRAMAQTMKMAITTKGCSITTCKAPEELKKAMSLLGAVASYLQVYNDTKTADPAEAKSARKKAIESLIDSSTDRSERRGKWIYSFGAPVGVSYGMRRAPMLRATSADFENDLAFNWRLPLSLAVHRTPGMRRSWGFHAALTFADLGNFARGSSNEQQDDIRWKDFLQLGFQIGPTLGNGKHTVVLAADVAWSPSLYRRELTVTHTDGTTETVSKEGAFTVGLTLAYYVPFFDLN